MKQKFIELIKSVIDLPDEQEEEIIKISFFKHIKKGEHFVRAGEIPNRIAFNMQGLFRYYYVDKKGNNFTKGFITEGGTVTAYSSMIQNRESYFSIEAMEDSTVASIQFDDWKKLLNKHECWKSFLIYYLEIGYCKKENREREFLLLDAEERYKEFLKNYPTLDKRIKQHYIASYLGITPVALSRIRKKMRIVNIG